MKPANNRKNEHVSIAEKFYQTSRPSDFDELRYVHHSFPEMNVKEADISTSFAGFRMDQPFYINAMTGGSDWTKKINEKLATVAKETSLAMATGSISAALKDPSLKDSFDIIRQINTDGLLFANLGAGQTAENARKAIDLLHADALQIHINAPQELVMPEGDRDFSGWLRELEKIVDAVDVPVIAKEVGFGISSETVGQLMTIGIRTIDISGRGGTNFAQIENYRRKTAKVDYLEDWGQSSVISLLEAQPYLSSAEILASGGIRHPLDMVKSFSLGAKAAGLSGLFLHMVLREGVDETIQLVNEWKSQLAMILTMLGKKSIQDLQYTDLVLLGGVKDWCLARDIPYQSFAARSRGHKN